MRRILLVAAVAAGLTTVAAPAYAAPSTGAGFVWAGNPTSAFYTPDANYNYNSTDPLDPVNTVTRTVDATGPLYTVRFPDLGKTGGTVQVTAYGSGSDACQVQSWSPSGDDQLVRVRCFNNFGTAISSPFTVAYTNVETSEDGVLGYVWANNASTTVGDDYTPHLTYQANSGGGVNTITRIGTGSYSVHLPGLGNPDTSHVQITPYGSVPARCVATGWGYNSTGNALDASVRCYSFEGAPTDARFTLTIAGETNILGLGNCCDPGGHPSAYALVYTPNVNGDFDLWPPKEYSSSAFGDPVGERLGVGRYSVSWLPYVSHAWGNVQVTTYSGQADNCKVAYWNNLDGIRVNCYDTSGDPIDVDFTLAFTGRFQLIIP